jgi:hypothetical protein
LAAIHAALRDDADRIIGIETDRIRIRGSRPHIEAKPRRDRSRIVAKQVVAAYRGKSVLDPHIRHPRHGKVRLA